MIHRGRLLCVLILFVISGCAYYPKPFLPEQELPRGELQRLAENIREQNRAVESFRGLSRTRITRNDEGGALRHAIVLAQPDRLRIDTLAPNTAYTLGLFLAVGQHILYIDPSEKTAYEGEGERLVQKAVGVPLSASELSSYIVGRVPVELLERGLSEGKLQGYADDAGIVLVWDDFRYYWRIDPASLLLQEVQIRKPFSRKVVLGIDYDRTMPADGVAVPQSYRMTMPSNDVVVELNFTSVSVNAPVPEAVFNVAVPAGYKVRGR